MAKTEICSNCGFTGTAKKVTKGSTLMELILWLCFIFPGLLYSMWRLSSKHMACAQCGSTHLIPLDSPRGKKLQQEFSH